MTSTFNSALPFRAVVIVYGDPLPLGVGSFDHPAGDASCALMVDEVFEFLTEDLAIEFAIEREADPEVHEVVLEDTRS